MLPRAFLEPFVSRKSRGTGHLASSSFTTKRTRNGRDPRRIPPLRIEFDHLFAGTKHENVANFLVEFIYLFIYLYSFFQRRRRRRRRKTWANHSWHTQTTQNSIQARRCFELGGKFVLLVFRDTYIHFLRAEREREEKSICDSIT